MLVHECTTIVATASHGCAKISRVNPIWSPAALNRSTTPHRGPLNQGIAALDDPPHGPFGRDLDHAGLEQGAEVSIQAGLGDIGDQHRKLSRRQHPPGEGADQAHALRMQNHVTLTRSHNRERYHIRESTTRGDCPLLGISSRSGRVLVEGLPGRARPVPPARMARTAPQARIASKSTDPCPWSTRRLEEGPELRRSRHPLVGHVQGPPTH